MTRVSPAAWRLRMRRRASSRRGTTRPRRCIATTSRGWIWRRQWEKQGRWRSEAPRQQTEHMKKRIILVVLLLAAATAGVYAYRSAGRVPSGRIVVSGNIELTEVNISFKTAGRLIERTVDEGDKVTKGQVIARLDRDQLDAQKSRETAGVASSQAQFAQAETALAWQKATLAGDIEQRKADIAANEARLQELRNGSRPQEKQEAQAAVNAAQSEFDRAKRDWDRAQTLYKNDDISSSQFDQFRSRFEAA